MRKFEVSRRKILQGFLGLTLLPYAKLSQALNLPGAQQPNIIFILADDLGYADLGVYGQTDFQTPYLDKLAQQGMRFTQAYSNSAVCSATRFALITGRYQYRLRAGLEEPIPDSAENLGLPPEHPTLPSLLKSAGYNTALFGKWHLGSLPNFGPLKSGYDEFFGNYGGALNYFTHRTGAYDDDPIDLYEGEATVKQAGYYTDLIADRACAYIERKTDKPFFISLHFTAPHWPWLGPEDEASASTLTHLFHPDGGSLKTYGKMVAALDAAVGRVLSTLEKQNKAENTIVIFTSDNGGERFSKTWPFSGQKTELLEGGIRVPAMIKWPGKIKPGQVTEQVAMSMDWLPTLLAAAGAKAAEDYKPDGENLLPVILGEKLAYPRVLYWRYKAQNQVAIRSENWKYLKINGNEFLFDLANDQRERANLASRQPQVLARLKSQWNDWNAQMLPITEEVRSHGVSGKVQADHYGVDKLKR